ncbi:MAG: copper chaperone PCu(A)C [Candidatus Puniceispirillales bacterium]
MSFKSISIFFNFLFFIFITSPSTASSIKFNGLVLSNFWIKETIGNHKITSGYLTIKNKNNFDERLETVTSEISEKTQLHNMIVKNDIMKMENLNNGIVIRAKSKLSLKPGSDHIMFMKLRKPLKITKKYKVILNFKNAGSVTLEMPVHKNRSNNKAKHHDHH